MSEAAATDEAVLEELLLDPEFVALSAAQPFNIFEAMGMVRAEIRHSHFLAHLLDPNGSHGLGDRLLRTILVEACRHHSTLRVADILLASFDDAIVERERFNVDILVTAPALGLVFAIENKIGSGEHDDQLSRYRATLEREFAGFPHRVLVYLTPDRAEPSDHAYIALGYSTLVAAVESLRDDAAGRSGIQLVLDHYARLLRTHVVTDERVVQLCRKIYQRHRRAIDLVVEHGILDKDEALACLVREVAVDEAVRSGLVEDQSSAKTLRFADPALDAVPGMLSATSVRSGRLLLYEVQIRQDRVQLVVQLGPGDAAAREAVHAALDCEPFRRARLYPSYYTAYTTPLLSPEIVDGFDADAPDSAAMVRAALASNLRAFVDTVVTRIRQRLTALA
jgi:hypothetical protein